LHVQANQRAERLEAALAERDGESVRLRSRIESAEGEAQACRGKHEAALAAHQAERLRLEERNVAATSRWLTEVDRVRQNAKEQERHLKDFQRQVTQLLADRNALRQEIQGARAHLKTAIAVREQLELGAVAAVGGQKAEEIRLETSLTLQTNSDFAAVCARVAVWVGWRGGGVHHEGGSLGSTERVDADEDPAAWRGLMDDFNLMKSNQAVLPACRAAAQKTKKEQHCGIVVPTP
jgi:hypothetical protein